MTISDTTPTHTDAAGASAVLAAAQGATLLYLSKQLERSVRGRLEEVVGEEKLTSLQYTALTVLERSPGRTAAVLARNSFVRAQTMAQMIDTLEARQLISRVRDSTNRRQNLLFLTDAGQAVLDRLRGPVADVEARMVRHLEPAQVDAFRSALLECRRALVGDDDAGDGATRRGTP